MLLTLKQAAEETGRTKQALQQAIKSGRVSAQKNDFNEWRIDPAELFRVYQPVKHLADKSGEHIDDALHQESQELAAELKTTVVKLSVNLDAKDKEIALLEKRAADLAADRDNWREQAQRLALTYQKPAENAEAFTASPAYQVKLSSQQILIVIGCVLLAVLAIAFVPALLARASH